MKCLFSSLLIFLIVPAMAQANLSAIFHPKSKADLRNILSSPDVLSQKPIFSPSEKKQLVELGEERLAQSIKIEIKDQRALERLKAWLLRNRIESELEENHTATVQGISEADLQWGLSNVGKSKPLEIDDLNRLEVPGVKGEDSGSLRAPSEPGEVGRIKVAVLDTGIDLNHPLLKDRIFSNTRECEALKNLDKCQAAADGPVNELLQNEKGYVNRPREFNALLTQARVRAQNEKNNCTHNFSGQDSDGNGYPLDCHGWNVTGESSPGSQVSGNNDVQDGVGHGTHVAGVIAALAEEGGLRGVAQKVVIIPVKVIESAPNSPIRPSSSEPSDATPRPSDPSLKKYLGFTDNVARGILYAIINRANVINLSLAWPAGADSLLMRKMVKLAQSRGILVVAAAGNDSTEAQVMPCQYDDVICVGAHGPDGALTHFSNFGAPVDIIAPGIWILSTWPTSIASAKYTRVQGYEFKSGTSMASPFVAGALARLLESGFSPREAYARLVLGTRATLLPQLGPWSKIQKYAQFGNLDLARSFSVKPEALLIPLTKAPLTLPLPPEGATLAFDLPLKNAWASATHVRIHATLLNEGLEACKAQLTQNDWILSNVKSEQIVHLSGQISFPKNLADVNGRMILALDIVVDQSASRRVFVTLEIQRPVYPQMTGVESFHLTGAKIRKDVSLRSVRPFGDEKRYDYLTVRDVTGGWEIQSLIQKSDKGTYSVSEPALLSGVTGDLLLIDRLPSRGGEPNQYVLIIQSRKNGLRPKFEFWFLAESNLKLLKKIIYDNSKTVIPENFAWMKLGLGFTPAWVSFGFLPEADKPAFDPWDPNPANLPEFRFYYFEEGILRSLSAPAGYSFVNHLGRSQEQINLGQVPVILAQGDDYKLNYSVAEISDKSFSTVRSLPLARYRNMKGLPATVRVDSLDEDRINFGTLIGGPALSNSQRGTMLLNGGDRILDADISPFAKTDSVTKIDAAFYGKARASVFAETHYELQYNDLMTGQIGSTTLGRFSYLPSFIFSRSLFPAVVARGDKKIPAILIPANLRSGDDTIEVVVPNYDSGGKNITLVRPAQFRLKAQGGCESVGNPIEANLQSPTQLVFFCGDRFLRVPLSE